MVAFVFKLFRCIFAQKVFHSGPVVASLFYENAVYEVRISLRDIDALPYSPNCFLDLSLSATLVKALVKKRFDCFLLYSVGALLI